MSEQSGYRLAKATAPSPDHQLMTRNAYANVPGGRDEAMDRKMFMATVLISTAFAVALSTALRPILWVSVTTAFVSTLMAMVLTYLMKPILDRWTGKRNESSTISHDTMGKQREMERVREVEKRVEEAQEEAKEAREEARRAMVEVERKKKEVEEEKMKVEKARVEAGRQRQELVKELARLQQKAKEDEQLMASLQAEVSVASSKLLWLEEDKKRETERLETALQEANARAERAADDAQQAAHAVTRLQQQARDREREVAELRVALADAQAQLGSAAGARVALERELAAKTRETADLTTQLAEVTSRRDALQSQVDVFLPFFRRPRPT